ncbi:helix-turn-helix domain-containing protein [Glycomyces buryatensis]|uniref:Helix-turn-helix domain-containing protein n=1 Tax=Glycomyces buryatensis TaxID=2570927 RepID=A0A4V6T6Q4_9ACTN|nr:helix-turn-helix transcriptional regulator [Glycomyces buryatensis]THV41306.1 helix-turn-helix domain-containing protein [Glycomyces buryatensis]
MAPSKRPTWRARWLGRKLRELRENKDLPVKDVCDYMGVRQPTVNRYETGQYPVKPHDLETLLDLYGVDDIDERVQLLRLAQSVTQRGWWDAYVSSEFADFLWAESQAETIKAFALDTWPGLIQSPEFAKALISQGPQSDNTEEATKLLKARVMRGATLRKADAPEAKFLIHESILSQNEAGREVTAAQLRYVLELANLPNVSVRIFPAESWAHTVATIGTSFRILEMREAWPMLMQVVTPIGGVVDEGEDVESFADAYDALWNEHSLGDEDTIDRLRAVLKEVE